jgi:hypothetical protein
MALLGLVDKQKTSDQEKKPQRHKGHRENAKLIRLTSQTIDKRAKQINPT